MRAVPTVVILLTCAAAAAAQGTVSREFTEAEAVQRIKELTPKPSAFVFVPQPGWSANLVRGAVVRKAVPSDAQAAARMAIDWERVLGMGRAAWRRGAGTHARSRPARNIRPARGLHSVHRCERNGRRANNALRAVAMSTAPALSGPFTRERLYAVEGPSAMCLKTVGGGQNLFLHRSDRARGAGHPTADRAVRPAQAARGPLGRVRRARVEDLGSAERGHALPDARRQRPVNLADDVEDSRCTQRTA